MEVAAATATARSFTTLRARTSAIIPSRYKVYTVRIFEFEVFVAVADLLCCRGSDGSCNRADRLERLDICNGKNKLCDMRLPSEKEVQYLVEVSLTFTELILAEFLYLQYEDEEKPIYLYINSTGTTNKLGYDTEAFAIYDVMGYVKPPIFTLCVRNAWREAALLLTAGAKGNCSALPS
uniref:ATP-dependent Clp protease proteolytic subunit n=1 Tax=Brassica oleracea TaxID=3712 RepID=A0A3P6GDE6_BRAOL|nr:unnamed protein product [Brassica oleracea]